MRESLIEKHLVKCAKEAGGEVRKVRFLDRRGAPDRLVMLPFGETVWVELKATRKKPKVGQEREHARMRKVGQTVLVFDSIEAIDKWFEER